jgi:hypothetical protein
VSLSAEAAAAAAETEAESEATSSSPGGALLLLCEEWAASEVVAVTKTFALPPPPPPVPGAADRDIDTGAPFLSHTGSRYRPASQQLPPASSRSSTVSVAEGSRWALVRLFTFPFPEPAAALSPLPPPVPGVGAGHRVCCRDSGNMRASGRVCNDERYENRITITYKL